MKLAIFLPGLYEGGAERVMLHLAEGLTLKGVEVHLVMARAEGPNLPLVPENVWLVDLKAKNTFRSLFPLVDYINREQPDALLSGLFANIIAIAAAHRVKRRPRVVVCEHNTLSVQVYNNRQDWRFRILPLLARVLYPKADQIVAVSEGVKKDIAKVIHLPGERIRVIYNPVVTPELLQMGDQLPEHPWLRQGEPPVILSVGRLVPIKEFDSLIRVFARVCQEKTCRMIILGEGPEREKLQGLIAELGLDNEVQLPGFIENPYPLIGHASLYVLCSRHEGLPGALIEAMAFGVPLVSTDCPSGPREILQDGKYGRLVPCGDWQALEMAIRDGLVGKIPPPEKSSWQRFSLDQVVDQYEEVLFPGSV
jgi:glycosyltransferase involved in cell wall biosynthesis